MKGQEVRSKEQERQHKAQEMKRCLREKYPNISISRYLNIILYIAKKPL